MSEKRDTPAPGDPVEEEVSTQTEVLAAARRATEEDPAADGKASDQAGSPAGDADETAVVVPDIADDELARREAASKVDTELNLEQPISERVEIVEVDEMPSAAAEPKSAEPRSAEPEKPEPAPVAPPRAPRDGEIPVDSVDQFSALYTQTPPVPDLKGNRLAGVLITLLATLVFAVLLAGVISILIARDYPPSTFFTEGLLPRLYTYEYGGAVAGFLVAQIILVLILGKANWWAYAIGGFFVGVVVWVATLVGGATHDTLINGVRVDWDALDLVAKYGFVLFSLVAGVIAREVSLWFGHWIGRRGRKVKQRNAEALDEYEKALAEAGSGAR